MKTKVLVLLVAIAAIIGLYSCTKDKTGIPKSVDCSSVNSARNTYSLNIGPNIVDIYCNYSPCHGGGSAGGGVDMSSYSATVNSFKNSTVICAMQDAGCELMPKGGPKLADSLILQMQCWQANGYPQ